MILRTNPGIVCLALFLLSAAPVFAVDFGLIMNQSPRFASTGSHDDDEKIFSHTMSAVPWFSATLDKALLFFSGSLAGLYDPAAYDSGVNENEWTFVPELLRCEATIVPRPGTLIRVGRVNYSAPAPYVASGLFDGFGAQIGFGNTSLSLGAYYTGLLWKKTAYITLSPDDAAEYAEETRFDGSYLAPKRFVFNVGADSGGIFLPADNIRAAVVGQFDFRDDDKIHSQYLSLAYSVPIQNFGVSASFTFELIEIPDMPSDEDEFGCSAAADFGAYWQPPTGIQDRLSFDVLWTSGSVDDGIDAFAPITTEPVGHVLQAKQSGITSLGLNYQARPLEQVSAAVEVSYFFRGDRITYTDIDLDYEDEDAALGGEIYGSVQYSPFSDVAVNAGAGAYFPQMGNAYNDDVKTRWVVTMGLIVSLW